MTEPKTATAAAHPCELYTHSDSPRPARTQYHHRYPEYLQKRLWGETRYEGPEDMMWLCGLCHDNVHEVVGWLLGETRQPDPMPGWKARVEAERTVGWYRDAVA